MAVLSASDERFIRSLREAGALTKVDPELFRAEHGTIFVTCSDGHHFEDIYGHHRSTCRCDKPMHHPIALNGGALLLAEGSPLIEPAAPEDLVILRHMKGAIRLKGADRITLLVHAPCGMAGLCGVSVEESFPLLFKAKDRVRKELAELGHGNITVGAHFHVCYPDNTRRTYFVDRSRFPEHIAA